MRRRELLNNFFIFFFICCLFARVKNVKSIETLFWSVRCYIFVLLRRLQPIRKHEIPTRVNSASLHPDNSTFVCGGEDFKMYKCDYVTGAELGVYAWNMYFVL